MMKWNWNVLFILLREALLNSWFRSVAIACADAKERIAAGCFLISARTGHADGAT